MPVGFDPYQVWSMAAGCGDSSTGMRRMLVVAGSIVLRRTGRGGRIPPSPPCVVPSWHRRCARTSYPCDWHRRPAPQYNLASWALNLFSVPLDDFPEKWGPHLGVVGRSRRSCGRVSLRRRWSPIALQRSAVRTPTRRPRRWIQFPRYNPLVKFMTRIPVNASRWMRAKRLPLTISC